MPQVNIHVFHVPLPIKEMKGANARAEQIREAAIAALAPDVVHVSSMFEGYGDNAVTSVGQFVQIPTVVTFYDMIPWIHRNIYLIRHLLIVITTSVNLLSYVALTH